MLNKIVKGIASLAIALATPYIFSQKAVAAHSLRDPVKFTEIRLYRPSSNPSEQRGIMVVPDRNVSVSAYGTKGKMRLYDVHIARMIAFSHHFYCGQPYAWNRQKTMVWQYWTDNGRIYRGTFVLPCNQVERAVRTYGLGKTATTEIVNYIEGPRRRPITEFVDIRKLRLTGRGEVKRFVNFARSIRPEY